MSDKFINTHYGYCYYCLDPYPLIYGLYVNKDYRKMGKSRRLLKMVISEIEECVGVNKDIFIQVDPRENSISKFELESHYKRMNLTILPMDSP